MMQPVTCDLAGGITVIFDAPETESEDHDETHLVYEFWAAAVG